MLMLFDLAHYIAHSKFSFISHWHEWYLFHVFFLIHWWVTSLLTTFSLVLNGSLFCSWSPFGVHLNFIFLFDQLLCKGNPQLPPTTLPTFSRTLWLHVTSCNAMWSFTQKSHWVTLLMDHLVCVAYYLLWLHHPPFHSCAIPMLFHSISTLFHLPFPMSSIFHILLLSPFHDPLLVARCSDHYVVALCLGSP